jgi:hypothetical protein
MKFFAEHWNTMNYKNTTSTKPKAKKTKKFTGKFSELSKNKKTPSLSCLYS